MNKSKSLQDLLEGMGLGADETDFKTEMFNLTEIDDPPVKCPDDEMDGTYQSQSYKITEYLDSKLSQILSPEDLKLLTETAAEISDNETMMRLSRASKLALLHYQGQQLRSLHKSVVAITFSVNGLGFELKQHQD